jgi:hypothetical protein
MSAFEGKADIDRTSAQSHSRKTGCRGNHAHSIAMSERPVITAHLIVAAASRRCALITVTAANNAAVTQKISLSGIIIILTSGLSQENKAAPGGLSFMRKGERLLLAKDRLRYLVN